MTDELPRHLGIPPLHKLGHDLLRISFPRLLFNLALPFFWCLAYFCLAWNGWWAGAVFCLVALSFVTYGSISHDLVHRNLGLPGMVNDVLLCVIELLAVRSGHAYQAAHLHHHARYPAPDDVEGAAAGKSMLGALAEGLVFQFRIWFWARRNAKAVAGWVIGEGVACVTLFVLAATSLRATPIFFVYTVLMLMGSWVIPLVTSYVPHDPHGTNKLFQTRAFRGIVASVLAFEHLYHLEHHLYPAVPHQNWPRLAKRLDPYLAAAGVKPIYWWA